MSRHTVHDVLQPGTVIGSTLSDVSTLLVDWGRGRRAPVHNGQATPYVNLLVNSHGSTEG
jgi:hypothetical protein